MYILKIKEILIRKRQIFRFKIYIEGNNRNNNHKLHISKLELKRLVNIDLHYDRKIS